MASRTSVIKKKRRTTRILMSLGGVDSSGIRVGNDCLDVDTSMRILIVENLFWLVKYAVWN
jgi:hypothetical protein